LEVEIVALSRQGGRDYNEDVYGHWNDGQYVACLVADGAGGHGGGDVAAGIARSSVLDGYARCPTLDPAAMRSLIERANLDVVARQSDSSALASMRSTVVLAALNLEQQQVSFAHCGDSRAYLFRAGELVARTTDHSLVQEMVATGMLDDEGARLHPTRNVLLSALGSIDEALEVSVSGPLPLQPGDALLLCSDGLWEPLGDAMLVETLKASPSPASWLQLLEQRIRTHAKPGHDNYTALTLWAHAGDVLTRLQSPARLVARTGDLV
jgi:serine/threonine protein phosphatase PrpC